MLSEQVEIARILSETLKIISSYDFPQKWENLLPELVKRLNTDNLEVLLGILKTLNSVFKPYRHKMPSNELLSEMIYVMDNFAEPMLQLFNVLSAQVDANLQNVNVLKLLLKAIKILFEIFYSLNAVELPEFFEDHIEEWFLHHKKFLNFESNLEELNPMEGDPSPTIVTKIQAAILRNVDLYSSKYDVQFEPFLGDFLQDTWNLLMKISQYENQPAYDLFVNTAMSFLSTIARSVFHTLFGSEETLRNVCENVAFRNIRFTEQDQDMFDYEPLDYIRSDIEGANIETRRHTATELIKSLREHYETQVTELFSGVLNTLLDEYSQDPDNKWTLKDQVIYLVIALAIVTKSRFSGVTKTNELVPIIPFFESHIITELSTDVERLPVIKADCLKYVLSFRMQLSSQHYAALLPLINNLLNSKSLVVASYAAICIDRLLLVRDNNSQLRMPKEVLQQQIPSLLTNLFGRMSNPNPSSRFEAENEYFMKAVLRLISTSREYIIPMAADCLTQLTSLLANVYKNSTYPQYLHYLFESLSAIIRILVDNNDFKSCEDAEQHLLPAFTTILEEDIMELAPYIFQILAQLIEARKNSPDELIARYGEQFKQYTSSLLWERQGNIPALTRLLRAYIKFTPTFIIDQNRLNNVLGIFQRLIQIKSFDKYGFEILQDIVIYLPRESWMPYITDVFKLFLGRLHSNKTVGFITNLIVFNSLLMYRESPLFLIEKYESIQQAIFERLLTKIIIPNLSKLSFGTERKIASIGLTQLLCSDIMLQQYFQYWPDLLSGILEILLGLQDDTVPNDFESDIFGLEEQGGFTSVFQQLAYSKTGSDDILGGPVDTEEVFVKSLSELTARHQGQFTDALNRLPPSHQKALQELLGKYNVTLS